MFRATSSTKLCKNFEASSSPKTGQSRTGMALNQQHNPRAFGCRTSCAFAESGVLWKPRKTRSRLIAEVTGDDDDDFELARRKHSKRLFRKKKRRYLENWKSVIKVEREEAITWDAKVTGNGGTKVTLQGGCTFFCKLFVSHAVSCQCRWSEPAKCCCAAKTCSVNWNGLVGFCVCQGFVVAFYGRSSGEIFWADFVLSTTRRCFE